MLITAYLKEANTKNWYKADLQLLNNGWTLWGKSPLCQLNNVLPFSNLDGLENYNLVNRFFFFFKEFVCFLKMWQSLERKKVVIQRSAFGLTPIFLWETNGSYSDQKEKSTKIHLLMLIEYC